MKLSRAPVKRLCEVSIIARSIAIALVCVLAACSGPPPVAQTNAPFSSGPLAMQPDHSAGALPGATLPCGWPGHAKGHSPAIASCTIAKNVHYPAIRNPHFPVAKIPGLHPSDIRDAYGLALRATGMTVGVVDAYDDTRAEHDMKVYRSRFGLPPCTTANRCFRKVNQRGQSGHYPHSSRTWSQETALDIEMISAVCPRCPILLVEADTPSIDDLGASVDEAVLLGARVVSNSYYSVEWSTEASEDAHYNHPGVAIVVSSGDTSKPAAYYPAASPYVTAVGATTLEGSPGNWTETAWSYGGQGCSLYEPRPAFQPAICSTRSAVDMAAVGDPQTGVTEFATQSGGWIVSGGTSVGAPIIAAAYALSANPAGLAYSYSHPGDFHDVLPAGFDLATGLGTPNGVAGL
jgi:subtilase family serine protease